MLCAVGEHEPQFSQRRKASSTRTQQDRAQLFSHCGSTWLPSGDQVDATFTQIRGQVFHLRGFTHAVQTFKSDKFAALWKRHDRDLIINQRILVQIKAAACTETADQSL